MRGFLSRMYARRVSLSAFKLCRISHLRESGMTRYLRRGCGGLDRRLHLRARGYQAASFRGGRGKLRARDGHRGESAASFTWLHDRHGVNIFVSASYVGTGCRRAGPPPKAGPAQAAVDSATEAPESGWFLAYSSSLGRRVIGEIIPESCIHLCEEPVREYFVEQDLASTDSGRSASSS